MTATISLHALRVIAALWASPNSLMGALEMMQSRLRNISLAIREVAFEIDSRATTMPAGQIRDTLRSDVERLRSAIDRLQIERTEPPAQP